MNTKIQWMQWQFPAWLPLLAVMAVMLLLAAMDWFMPVFSLTTGQFLQGDVWRLVTAHYVHINGWHLIMNLAAFGLVYAFFAKRMTSLTLLVWLLAMPILLSLFLCTFAESSLSYMGFSGLIFAGLVMFLILNFPQRPLLMASGLLFVVVKLASEMMIGGEGADFSAYVLGSHPSHFYGALLGTFFGLNGLLLLSMSKAKRRKAL